ncbi:unnamed protein product, partial [Aphanomyces euteiches]
MAVLNKKQIVSESSDFTSIASKFRPVKTKRFKVKGPNSRSILDDEEESLKKLAAECGVEFM